jgi:hypothetical protein
MHEKLVGAVLMSVFLGLAGCDDGGGDDPGPGGTGGGGACEGIERVCNTDKDCPSLQVCSTECGECVVDKGSKRCVDTSDCTIGEACRVPEGKDETRCVRVVCERDEDCAEDEACQEQRGACVPGDCRELGCPEGNQCRTHDGVCVECLNNNHCAGTDRPFCDETANTCVECEYDGDCGSGKCDHHVCVDCVTDADCTAPARFCRDDGACVECRTDDDCFGVECLDSGRCDLGPIAGEMCDPGRKCAPGYVCLGEDPGICLQPCNPYEPACGEGDVCALYGDGQGYLAMEGPRPAGVCVENDGGLGENAVCDDTHTCRADLLCLRTDPTTSRCRLPCNPGAASTCGTGLECEGLAVGSGNRDVGFCQEPSTWLDECTSNEDCGEGLGCRLGYDSDAKEPLTYCDYTDATGGALAPCDEDEDCLSGICLGYDQQPTYCYGMCEVDADCGFGTCREITFGLQGGGSFTVAGCWATCGNDADCAALGLGCGLGVDPGTKEIVTECAPLDEGAGPGQPCTQDSDCALGFCVSDAPSDTVPGDDGFCVGPCETNADCGPNTACRGAVLSTGPNTYDSAPVCWGKECVSAANCPAGWACVFESSPENPQGAIRYSCMPGEGNLGAGEYCTDDADCLSGACVSTGIETICYGPCASDTDCSGDTYCESQAFTYTLPNGTQVTLSACVTYY